MKTKNNKSTYHPSIEILNSEGPILKAVKLRDYFVILDEDQEQIDVLTDSEMLRFAEGIRSVQDSRGRVWNYSKVDRGMKVEKDKLLSFIGLFYEIDTDRLHQKYVEEFGECDMGLTIRLAKLLENNPSLILKK